MRAERGQATVEWVGLLLLAMLVLAAVLVTVGWGAVRTDLRDARSCENLVCAVRLAEDCREEPELRATTATSWRPWSAPTRRRCSTRTG